MLALNLIVLLFLVLASILDLKYKQVPSIILTGMIFVVVVLAVVNDNTTSILFGLVGLIFSIILYEGEFIGGIADIKILSLMSMLILNELWLFGFIILILLLGVCWKAINKYYFNKKDDIAFIPLLTFVYIVLLVVGGLSW